MDGKITLELEVNFDERLGNDNVAYLTHPDLEGQLYFRFSTRRLAEAQMATLNVDRPKTPIEEIVADSQELVQAVAGLKQMVPEIMSALKGKK